MAGLHAEQVERGVEETIFSAPAVEFLHVLHRRFAPRREELLIQRLERQRQFDRGHFPELVPGEGHQRDSEWTVAPIPPDFARRPVMITGAPWEALSGGLQSGAGAFVADFDDCSSPVWSNCLEEHAGLRDAVCQRLAPRLGRPLPASQPAVLFLRPRNWLLEEKHLSVDGKPISAALFDFGLYFFHNAATLLASGNMPCFSLPKLEGPLEARLWNEIFAFSEAHLGIPHGSIRAVVTIETLSAAFAMEEILFELRDYAFALASSPSNYLSNYIQALRAHSAYLLPQCSDLSMERPFLHAYQELLIHSCHKRAAYAIGDCHPEFPADDRSRRDQWAKTTVRLNARSEAEMGFDGTSVGRIDLVPVVLAALAEPIKNHRPIKLGHEQRSQRQCYITASDLIARARGQITAAAIEANVTAALSHLEAWLAGQAVPYRGRRAGSMATAELCRAQLWQWIRHSARLAAGPRIDQRLVASLIRDCSAASAGSVSPTELASSRFSTAGQILLDACTGDFESPLAMRAYAHVA